MKRQIVASAIIVLLGLAGGAWASEFSEDFESYIAGTDLHGQGGWKGWNNSASAGALVSNLYARGGRQSVEISRDSDLVHEFSLSGGKWILTAWQYVPSHSTGVSYFILLNTYNDDGPHDWSIQTQYDLETGAIVPFSGDTGSGARIAFDQWVEIRLVIDLSANTFEEYYDGTQIAVGEWDDDLHGTLQAIDLFANEASSVYYDDIKIDSGTTASVSCFPRPAYNSGWIVTPFGDPTDRYGVILAHNLGGDTDNYVIDLQWKVSGIAGPNLSNQGLGSTFSYSFLTDRTVTLSAPYSAVDLVTSLRIRIWTYDCDTESSEGEPKTE
ncbi:MAG: hypothetical protein KBE65_22785 [Phycisphaerae bacterium]|nr:hypothetical protein [Phycisphaerae bacterium]